MSRWAQLLSLPKFSDKRGSLSVIEANETIPFEIKRVFFFYDIPPGESRGSCAHKTMQEGLFCLSGSFDVILDDGRKKELVRLNRPWRGCYIPPMLWTTQMNFTPGAIGLVIASDHFDESDCYRDYAEFLAAVRSL